MLVKERTRQKRGGYWVTLNEKNAKNTTGSQSLSNFRKKLYTKCINRVQV